MGCPSALWPGDLSIQDPVEGLKDGRDWPEGLQRAVEEPGGRRTRPAAPGPPVRVSPCACTDGSTGPQDGPAGLDGNLGGRGGRLIVGIGWVLR